MVREAEYWCTLKNTATSWNTLFDLIAFEKNYDDSVLNRADINLALNLQGQLGNGINDKMKQTTKEILPYSKKSWA